MHQCGRSQTGGQLELTTSSFCVSDFHEAKDLSYVVVTRFLYSMLSSGMHGPVLFPWMWELLFCDSDFHEVKDFRYTKL